MTFVGEAVRFAAARVGRRARRVRSGARCPSCADRPPRRPADWVSGAHRIRPGGRRSRASLDCPHCRRCSTPAFVERRAQAARRQFDGQLADTTKVPELVAIRVVHRFRELLEASSGSLTLTRQGLTRRIAAVGSPLRRGVDECPARRTSIAGSHRVHARARRRRHCGVSTCMRVPPGSSLPTMPWWLTPCASALRTWLAGTLTSFDATAAILDVNAAGVPPFLTRIQEELERGASIRSSSVAHSDRRARAVRHDGRSCRRRCGGELRGSDVTGAMGGSQVAALLTHTDALGLDNVVRASSSGWPTPRSG